MRLLPRLFPVILALWLVGCGEESAGPESGAADAVQAEQIDWDRLIPVDWQPETLLEGFDLDAVDGMDDDDPRAVELMDKLTQLWADAPVVQELDGLKVRLPGFVVPLEMDERTMSEFLLVPYYGACIHVPPPPANQTIHVVAPEGREYVGELFDTVWVTGTLRVVRSSSDLAEAGYRIDVTEIAPYEGEVEPL
ncbi:conserved hypothetical protein [Thiocapsa sp. KS1]|nr:DUF3299 domain-containing protein [Thiocapsa sp. KS1]CRI65453.1 conserved hypothetical protein [Thiocapsa sp. KS1]